MALAIGVLANLSDPPARQRATSGSFKPPTAGDQGVVDSGESGEAPAAPGPAIDIQQQGPLFSGVKVSLKDVRERVDFAVPDPIEDETTGELTGIWIDSSGQIAMVWASDLRLYLTPAEQTQAQLADEFAEKVANDEDQVAPWVGTSVNENVALGVEGTKDVPSSISFQAGGVRFEFVGPSVTLSELVDLSERTVASMY